MCLLTLLHVFPHSDLINVDKYMRLCDTVLKVRDGSVADAPRCHQRPFPFATVLEYFAPSEFLLPPSISM